MQSIELSFGQAFKILWSFIWRAWLLMIPLWVIMLVGMYFIMPMPAPGAPPTPPDIANMPIFFALWLVMMVGYLLILTQALRWTMKTEWSDFKIMVVPTLPPLNETSAP